MGQNEAHIWLIILYTNACIQPWTMVIKIMHTMSTFIAVPRRWSFYNLTLDAKILGIKHFQQTQEFDAFFHVVDYESRIFARSNEIQNQINQFQTHWYLPPQRSKICFQRKNATESEDNWKSIYEKVQFQQFMVFFDLFDCSLALVDILNIQSTNLTWSSSPLLFFEKVFFFKLNSNCARLFKQILNLNFLFLVQEIMCQIKRNISFIVLNGRISTIHKQSTNHPCGVGLFCLNDGDV